MMAKIGTMAVVDSNPHPRIPGRITGRVSVHLRESCMSAVSEHDLVIRAWADADAGTPAEEVEALLLASARRILDRTLAVAAVDPSPYDLN
jgi:hypothetical protein